MIGRTEELDKFVRSINRALGWPLDQKAEPRLVGDERKIDFEYYAPTRLQPANRGAGSAFANLIDSLKTAHPRLSTLAPSAAAVSFSQILANLDWPLTLRHVSAAGDRAG